MTLFTQNRILLWFSSFSAITSLCLIGASIYSLVFLDSQILQTLQAEGSINFFNTLFEQKSLYSIISLGIFSLYVPIIGFTIFFTFEKTKSSEILFYTAMLLGIFLETFRLGIPIFSLNTGYTLFFRTIARTVFFGQIQVMIAILFQGIIASRDASRESDKYIGIISVIALIFALIIPLNITNIGLSFSATYGFEQLFSTIRIIFIIITLGTMLLSSSSKKFKNYKKASISFFLLCIAYLLLLDCTTLFSLCLGTLLIVFGSISFLKHLHTYYMWK